MRQAISLFRTETGDHGTFGVITVGDLSLFTGELPWRNNEDNVSCIPAGKYNCRFTFSRAFKRYMYLVDSVENREGIRIHSANFMGDREQGFRSQLYGCIALGEKIGRMQNQTAVLLSAPAVRRFEIALERKPFELEIINGFG